MIRNDEELEVTQKRVLKLQNVLAQLRARARPSEFEKVSQGYRSELERMHREIMEYLSSLPSQASA